MKIRLVQVLIIGWLINVFLVGKATAQSQDVPSDSTTVKASSQVDTTRIKSKLSFRPLVFNQSNSPRNYIATVGTTKPDSSYEGKFLRDLNFSGLFRFITIYRNMQQYYPDMQTSAKNISFIDYPLAGLGTYGGVGNPMLALAMTGKVSRTADFRVGYSISHLFTGSAVNDYNKFFLSNGGLVFEGNVKNENINLNLRFGGLMSFRVGRLVFDAPRYRGNYFDVLVSNQYSVGQSESVYKNEDNKVFLYNYVKGGIANITFNKINNTMLTLMYGRTGNTAASPNNITIDGFPAINYLIRARTPFQYGPANGGIALNYYAKDADTDPVHGIKDNLRVYSTDFDLKIQRLFILKGAVGYSKIDNFLVAKPSYGGAYVFNLVPDERFKIPMYIEYYNISGNYGNLDSEVLNSNTALRSGGATNSASVDQTRILNVAQEVGMIANNRSGVSVGYRIKVGELRIELAYGVSQEQKNLHDSITFQHRVNAFSRSRFWQWQQGIGPYGRINSSFARTFELLTITDAANGISTNYRKGFNNIELLLKYKVNLFNRSLMFFNFSNFVSIQDHLSLAPVTTDQAFMRTFYNDFTMMYRITKKIVAIGNYGYERGMGNTRVNLSPDKVTDSDGNAYAAKDRVINQTGTAVGFGFGYDITSQMVINYRQKWMKHNDTNFALDHFKGQEYTMELKMFF